MTVGYSILCALSIRHVSGSTSIVQEDFRFSEPILSSFFMMLKEKHGKFYIFVYILACRAFHNSNEYV